MTSGTRLPTWKERENNKKRERRRRAIAAKIFSGLRLYGNYKLPKHCDNNEVLKALCAEAGWTVEEDGTTYRKGAKPAAERMDVCTSPSTSPTSSYPGASEGTSLIPWLKGLSSGNGGGGSGTASTCSSQGLPPLHVMHGGTSSAPMTPPLSSPTARMPHVKPDWDKVNEAGMPDCPASAFCAAVSAWTHPHFLAAVAASNNGGTLPPPQHQIRPAVHPAAAGPAAPPHPAASPAPPLCETTADVCRGSPSDGGESDACPSAVLEFVSGCSNSGKWTNGVRVRNVSQAGSALGLSGCSSASRFPGGMGLGPFPSSRADSGNEPFSNFACSRADMGANEAMSGAWRPGHVHQTASPSISVGRSDTPGKSTTGGQDMMGCRGLDLEMSTISSAAPGMSSKTASPWETPERNTLADDSDKKDDLELTLGSSTLRVKVKSESRY
ncbi:unnamed protein product [Calypogeia fissa]